MTEKKITLATLKSFIRKNAGELYIRNLSDFNGMTDGVEYTNNPQARQVVWDADNVAQTNTLGIRGVWVVGSGRDHITAHEKDGEKGLHVYNCCGSFDLFVITKTNTQQFYVIRNHHTQRAIAPYAGFPTYAEASGALASYKQAPVCDMLAYLSVGTWKDVHDVLWEYHKENMGDTDHAVLATMWATNKRLIALRAVHEAAPFLRAVRNQWGDFKFNEARGDWADAGLIVPEGTTA